MVRYEIGNTRVAGCVGLPFYIEWEVMRMKYDFKDLMAFGMFLLALLTLILQISH